MAIDSQVLNMPSSSTGGNEMASSSRQKYTIFRHLHNEMNERTVILPNDNVIVIRVHDSYRDDAVVPMTDRDIEDLVTIEASLSGGKPWDWSDQFSIDTDKIAVDIDIQTESFTRTLKSCKDVVIPRGHEWYEQFATAANEDRTLMVNGMRAAGWADTLRCVIVYNLEKTDAGVQTVWRYRTPWISRYAPLLMEPQTGNAHELTSDQPSLKDFKSTEQLELENHL